MTKEEELLSPESQVALNAEARAALDEVRAAVAPRAQGVPGSEAQAVQGSGVRMAPNLDIQAALDEAGLRLVRDERGLVLSGDDMEMLPDLTAMKSRLKPGRLNQELLVKAARTKGVDAPLAVDATAGLGQDSLLLAAAGFRVILFESNPVIAALLRDSLDRASSDAELAPIVERMTLVEGDSVAGLGSLSERPDVVLLDPMFPERRKSAAVKKKFQLIHHLELPCSNEEELLAAAIAAGPRKVVIKRPPKGPWLADKKPSYAITGKAVRYDCIVLPR